MKRIEEKSIILPDTAGKSEYNTPIRDAATVEESCMRKVGLAA